VAQVLYEELSTSAKIKAAIMGFVNGTRDLLLRLGKSIIEGRNRFKEALKQRKNITRALRICIVVASYAAVAAVFSHFAPAVAALTFIPTNVQSDIPHYLSSSIEMGLIFLVIND
jgi:hypothetical protein